MTAIVLASPEPFLSALVRGGAAFGAPFTFVSGERFAGSSLDLVDQPLCAAFVVNPAPSWSLRRLHRMVHTHTATAMLATAFFRDGPADPTDDDGTAHRWLSSTPGVFVDDPLAWARTSDTVTLTADIGAPAAARRFVRHALDAWDRSDLCETAALVLSELTTNAVLHAGGPTLAVSVARAADDANGVQLVVDDEAVDGLPVWRRPTPASRSGRGLRIVDAAASRWGVTVGGGHKRVWCEVTRPTFQEG